MTKQRLERNLDYLKVLSKAKKRQRTALLSTAERDLILCLCDCALNILNGNVPLNQTHFKKLKKYKLPMRNLIDKRIKATDKQNILINQKGGFLPILLAPILSIAGQILADSLLNKR